MKYILLISSFLFLIPFCAFSQQEMTYEQWEMELADAQKREQVAKEAIAQEQSKIESIKEEIASVDKSIENTKQETYALLGITEDDISAWNSEMDMLISKLEELAALIPDELVTKTKEIKDSENKLSELKENKVSLLFASAAKVATAESLIEQIKATLASAKPVNYTVRLIPEKRDCLWRIAGYEEIYNDPMQWPKLYEANKNQIDQKFSSYKRNSADPKYSKAEDLIFPGQIFDIPR